MKPMLERSFAGALGAPAPRALIRVAAPVRAWILKVMLMLLALLLCGRFAAAGWAKEIVSNGKGGGTWTAPDTWLGNVAPGTADSVIIQTNDTILFDGNYPDQAACRQLRIDPGARLNFKAEDAPHILSVAGPLEVRGLLHIDLSRFPQGLSEIRLVADKEAERIINVCSNGAFTAIGASSLADGRYNVIISTGPPRPGMPRRTGMVKSDPDSIINILDIGLTHPGEYHSNGYGGGNWSDPETWHDKIVPAEEDSVIIAANDTVVFDGHSPDNPSCRKIMIDPGGVLTFKTDEQPHVLSVAGGIESYGTIRMDGSKAPLGAMELRLVAETDAERTIRMWPNSALLLYGVEREGGRKNVVLSGLAAQSPQPRQASIVVRDESMVEIHGAELRAIVLNIYDLDNTGFKANERLNIAANYFTGQSRLSLTGCDTPAVKKNTFEYPGQTAQAAPAIKLNKCQLTEIKDNIITGLIDAAIGMVNDVDSAVIGNTITGARCGIYSSSGQNAMIRANEINDCLIGVSITESSGVLEGLVVRRTTTAINAYRSPIQITDLRVEDLPTNGIALKVDECSVAVLNANIATNQIRLGAPPAAEPWVKTMQYLIVQVKGPRPPDALIEVRTAAASGGVAQNAADLNVRNSPARLSPDGLTPLPRSLRPLIVRSWSLDRAGKKVTAPFYDLAVTAPAAKAGEAPRVLKSTLLEPKDTWFRPAPNQPEPTVAVTLP